MMRQPLFIFLLIMLLASCMVKDPSGSTGSVALSMADDISDYREVTAVINSVDLMVTSSGETCRIMDSQTFEITEYADIMDLVKITDCAINNYNRVRMTFTNTVSLINSSGVSASCTFESYMDNNNAINRLACPGDYCSLDMTGAVNVAANGTDKIALDFDLKNFTVDNFGLADCAATVKVSPLSASEMKNKRDQESYKESVKGTIYDLTATSFTLTKAYGEMFRVTYSAATTPGIFDALSLASTYSYPVRALSSSSINYDTVPYSIAASGINVILDNAVVSSLSAGSHHFTATIDRRQIPVSYTDGIVTGTLSDGATVNIRISGYQSNYYTAVKVKVQ